MTIILYYLVTDGFCSTPRFKMKRDTVLSVHPSFGYP